MCRVRGVRYNWKQGFTRDFASAILYLKIFWMIHVMFLLKISNIVCQLFHEIFKSHYFMVTPSVSQKYCWKNSKPESGISFLLQGGVRKFIG